MRHLSVESVTFSTEKRNPADSTQISSPMDSKRTHLIDDALLLLPFSRAMVPPMFRLAKDRDHQLLTLLLLLGVAFAMVPLWGPRLLPLLDLPNHLAAISIWNHYHEHEWGYQKYYQLSTPLVPYWGYYFPVHILSKLCQIETANKIFLSFYAVSIPFSVAIASKQFSRNPWVSILSLPFIFNYNLMYGFISYCAGLPFMLIGLVLLDKSIKKSSPHVLIMTLVASFAIYFMHLLNWFVFGLNAIALLLLNARRWRTGILAGLTLIPSVVFALWNVRIASEQKVLMSAGPVKFSGTWLPSTTLLTELPHRLLLDWTGSPVPLILVVLVLTVIVLIIAQWREAPSELVSGPERFSVEVMLMINIAAYCLLPFTLKTPFHWWNVGPRIATIAALFFIMLPRFNLTAWHRLLVLPAMLLSILYPLLVFGQFQLFNDRAIGMVQLAERIPRGSLVLTLTLGDKSDPAVAKEVVPYTEFPAYAQILVGGFNHVGWKSNFPFRLRSILPPAPHWARPTEFRQDIHGYHYDYVITQNEPVDGFLFGPLAVKVPLVDKYGTWRLYRTRNIR